VPDLDEQIRELVTGVKPVTAAEVIASTTFEPVPTGRLGYRRPGRLNTYAFGAAAMATAICVLALVLVFGVSSSSKTNVVSPASVPASWQRVSFGGLTMLAPGNWPVTSQKTWGDCGTAGQPLFKASSIVLDTGAEFVQYFCPLITSHSSIPPVYGLLVDPGTYGPLVNGDGFGKCIQINGLSVCPTATDYGGILVVAVFIPGVTRSVGVEIGLAGHGKVAHTILYSMRPAVASGRESPGATGRTFLALARHGADGTFSATYDSPMWQGAMSSTVTVAHQAPPGSASPNSGSWMFELSRRVSGARYLWVSHPHSTTLCHKQSSSAPWSCEQTSMTGGGNGWQLATALYLPLTELNGLQSAVQGADPSSVTTTRRVLAGLPVECLALEEANNAAHLQWCLTSSGVLASFAAVPTSDGFHFGDAPAEGTATSISSTVPSQAFAIPATPGAWVGPYMPSN
jgi:hypothetical protein